MKEKIIEPELTENKRGMTQEEVKMLHQGIRPEWMSQLEFKILRRLAQRQMNLYLKGTSKSKPVIKTEKKPTVRELLKKGKELKNKQV